MVMLVPRLTPVSPEFAQARIPSPVPQVINVTTLAPAIRVRELVQTRRNKTAVHATTAISVQLAMLARMERAQELRRRAPLATSVTTPEHATQPRASAQIHPSLTAQRVTMASSARPMTFARMEPARELRAAMVKSPVRATGRNIRKRGAWKRSRSVA